jgi:hypothetical protein
VFEIKATRDEHNDLHVRYSADYDDVNGLTEELAVGLLALLVKVELERQRKPLELVAKFITNASMLAGKVRKYMEAGREMTPEMLFETMRAATDGDQGKNGGT